jgi:aminopeptidase N
METVSKRDLGPFFTQWLHRGGNPKIDATWTYHPSRGTVDLTLRQTQPGESYALTVDVDVVTPAGTRRETVSLNARALTVSLKVDAEPSTVVIDPETWLLADVRITRR